MIQGFIEQGISEENAKKVADKITDFQVAAAEGDVKGMKNARAAIDDLTIGDVRKKVWDWKENLASIPATTLLSGGSAVPGTISSARIGAEIKADANSKEKISNALRKTIAFDPENSSSSQAILDKMEEGNEPTAVQVYDIMTNEAKVMREAAERNKIADNIRAKGVKRENLTAPPAVQLNDGSYIVTGKVTSEKYAMDYANTIELAQAINDHRYKNKMTDEDIEDAAVAVASYNTGVLTAEDAFALVTERPEVRSVFEEMTGENLSQYTVKKNGKVDTAATNIKIQEGLLAKSAQNYIQSARAEQENWNDETRGQVANAIASSFSTNGNAAVLQALDTVDARDQSAFLAMGRAAESVYDHAWHTQESWDEVKKAYKKMYKSLNVDALKEVYDAAKTDRQISETPYLNAKVESGKPLSEIDGERQGEVKGKFINETPFNPETGEGRDLKASERVVVEEIARGLNANVTMVDAQDERLRVVDKEGKESRDEDGNAKYANASVRLSTGDIFISNEAELNKIVHEATHMSAKLAASNYLDMAHSIMEAAYKYDPARTRTLEQKYRNLYEGQGFTDAQIEEEIVSDLVTDFFDDPAFARALAQENPNAVQKVIDAIAEVIRRLRNIIATGHIQDENVRNSFLYEIGIYEDARKMWIRAFNETSKARASQAINEKQDEMNKGTEAATKYSIKMGMTEAERFDELKNKTITVIESKKTDLPLTQEEFDRLRNSELNEAKKAAVKLAKALGVKGVYSTNDIDFEFEYSNNGIDESAQKQLWIEADDKFVNFVNLMANLDSIINNATLLEAHTEDEYLSKNPEHKKNEYLEATYVLVSSFSDENNFIPVKLTVMEYTHGEKPKLHVAMTTSEIKKSEIEEVRQNESTEISTPISEIMISDLLSKINDEELKKYIPKQFYEDQAEVKHSLVTPEQDADYMAAVEAGNMEEAQRLVDEAARAAMPNTKTPGLWLHGTENEFTVFDFSQGGKNGTAEGFGIYLARDRDVSEHYGKLMIEGYVNIEKPASSDAKTINKSTLKKLIKATVEDEANRIAEDYDDDVEAAKRDTWISNYVYTYDKSLDAAISEVADSILNMNFSDMEIIQEVMGGMAIRDYDAADEFYDLLTDLTGFDGFTTTWENQALEGTRDIALAFRSSQIKSADPVTYADDGSVIPLSERFNPENDDIRYSLPTTDADGKVLKDGQMGYFKNSQARDEQGRLVPVFHVTRTAGFTIFDPSRSFDGRSISFSNDIDFALNYSSEDGNIEDWRTAYENRYGMEEVESDLDNEVIGHYEVYLDIQNPLYVTPEMLDEMDIYEIPAYAQDNGYDGVIIRDFEGMGADIYQVFSSNQIKDTRNENPTENPDIRYSITPEDDALSRIAYAHAMDNSDEALEYYEQLIDKVDPETYNVRPFNEEKVAAFYAALNSDEAVVSADPVEEENRIRMARSKADFFANLNTKWNDRWRTDNEVLDVKSVKTDIRNLVMGVMNNSDTDRKYKTELVNKMLMDVRTAYQLLKQDRQEVAASLLYHSALRMVSDAEFYIDDTYDQYKELRDFFRTTKISLGEEYWDDVDFGSFRKNNFGRMKLVKGSTNVDKVYMELAEMFPEWFNVDETLAVPDMLEQMAHVLDAVQPYKEAYTSEAAAELAFDIADELYEIMVGGKEVKSLADQYKERYDAKTKAMKQRHAEAMLRMRQQKELGVQAERAKWRAREEARKERALHTTEIGQIQKSYKTLTDRLLTNTKDKHIPEQYKRELATVLKAFDFQTLRSKDLEGKRGYKAQNTIKMAAMKAALERIESKTQFFNLNDSVSAIMDELLGVTDGITTGRSIDGLTLDELSYSELHNINQLLKALVHEFNNYENVKAEGKRQAAADIGHAQNDFSMEHAKQFGEGKDYNDKILRAIDQLINLDEMTPAYMFRKIDPNNVGLGKMWKEIRRSFDKYVRNTNDLNNWIEEIVGEYHEKGKLWNKYGAGELSDWRSDNYALGFNLTNGQKIHLTPAQMMSVYCLSKRPQAYQHMVGTGIVVSPAQFNAQLMSDIKKKTNKALPVKLTDADIKGIIAQLKPEQIKVADQLQELMSTKMADWGNEASMNVIGIKLFTEENYFPIRSDKAGLTKDLDPNQFEQAIRNFGFTKAVQPGARNAIMIDDIFDVVTEHCNNMNLYNSYTEAMNDFMKVYNYREEREEGEYTVEQTLRHAFSDKAPTFIMQFIRDLNGNVSKRTTGIENLYNGLLANAKKASVFANLRVAAQQPTAISRAFYVIDRKYMKGIKISKGAMTEMFEHCPIALWKSWGYYDINMGKSIEDVIMNNGRWLEDKATDLYGALDNVTWTAIWQMVKAEMKDTHPDVKEGTEEYWELCNDRMTEIVDLTQVVDSPMHRSHAMRSKDFFHKLTTAFMAEPTLTFNMLRDGLYRTAEARRKGQIKLAAQILERTVGVYLLQSVMVAGAQAFVDALRGKGGGDDDEDDSFMHRMWVQFLENWKDEINPLGKMYVIKDGLSMLQGWENRNLALQGIQMLTLGIRQLNGDPYARSSASWWENIAYGLGYLTGVPIKTMKTGLDNGVRTLRNGLAFLGADTAVIDKGISVVEEKEEALDDLAKDSKEAEEAGFIGKLLNIWDGNEEASASKKKSKKSKDSGDKSAEMTHEEERDTLRSLDAKCKEKTEGLSGSELDEALWDTLSSGYTKKLEAGDYDYIEQLRNIYRNNGGDVSVFDAKIKDKAKSAYKKMFKDEMTQEDINKQFYMQMYMKDYLGFSDAEISELCYKSYVAKDLKVAFRINDEQAINETGGILVRAGITEQDWDKLYKNRNRMKLDTYNGKYKDRLKSTGTFIWPTEGVITSYFGHRDAPTAGASSNHPAIDIGAAAGTDVVAADGGTVIYVGYNGGYGKSVGIKHDNGMVTYYNHLSSYSVNEGDSVAQGQYIAAVGSTGISTGAHLDFKVLDADGNPVDPMDFLDKRS